MYMSKEVLINKAVGKLKELSGKDFGAMKSREKALHSIELDKLYNDLSPLRTGSEVAGSIANDCMAMKVRLIQSDYQVVDNTKQKRAKVIMQGVKESPYNIPWLNQ